MFPGIEKRMMQLRMEFKAKENSEKPPLTSPDAVQTSDFVFSPIRPLDRIGDSGQLLLAKRKSNRKEQYLVKHAYTDCASNEYVCTKLVQAMGYHMPDAVLFQLSENEKRKYFKTEYIIGLRYLDIEIEAPTYAQIREKAKNWREYFSLLALYAIFKEADSFETPLAGDGYIYRVDTTAAFPISNYQLDCAGVDILLEGKNFHDLCKKQLLSSNLDNALDPSWCNIYLESALKTDMESRPYFMEPFARIQEVSPVYIDDFLNTLCYFYPDFYRRLFQAISDRPATAVRNIFERKMVRKALAVFIVPCFAPTHSTSRPEMAIAVRPIGFPEKGGCGSPRAPHQTSRTHSHATDEPGRGAVDHVPKNHCPHSSLPHQNSFFLHNATDLPFDWTALLAASHCSRRCPPGNRWLPFALP